MKDYKKILSEIEPVNEDAINSARIRMDNLVKPYGSLGRLEEIAVRLTGITRKIKNNFEKRCTIVMAADNGVFEEGISSSPKAITLIQAINMTKGITGIGALSKVANADVKVVDIGIDSDLKCSKWINKKIAKGTKNIAKGPAMTIEEAEKAINVGIEIIDELVKEGYDLIGTGELGIGNTSTSSAIIMVLSESTAAESVGKGGGLTDKGLENKIKVVEKAIKVNRPDIDDPLDVLYKLGGFDIAGLTGCFIGAAYHKIPIVIDGIISLSAAMIAYRMNPEIRNYMIPSHLSQEPGFKIAMEELDFEPILDLKMRLGEGTGCPLAFNIIDAACSVMNNMALFEEIEVSNDYI